MTKQDSKSFYQRSKKPLVSPIGQDFVALDIDSGRCFAMEEVTAEIWRTLESPTAIDDLCAHLVAIYDVAPEQCQMEVSAILDQMVEAGLILRR